MVKNTPLTKKGYFFSIDALIAIAIIIGFLAIFSISYHSTQPDVQHIYYSSDLAEILSTTKMVDLNTSALTSLLAESNLTNYNLTIMEQIGRYWAVGDVDKAEALSASLLGTLIPPTFGYSIVAEGETLYSNNKPVGNQLFSARQIISGLEQGDVIFGQSARVFLTGINARSDTAYIYFGGYEGDGNLSKIVFLPADFYNIDEVYLELDTGGAFDLYINGQYSGTFNKTNVTYGASKWFLSPSYFPYFVPNQNNLSINFKSSSQNYIGGGFIKIHYATAELGTSQIIYGTNTTATERYFFPGIHGIINLYSSFYIPGNLTSLTMYLHYFANHSNAFNSPLFVAIGKETVFTDTTSVTEQMVTLTDAQFSELNYSALSMTTLPLRFGFENLTSVEILTGSFQGDSVLITDVSGSMGACDIDKTGYQQVTCPSNPADPEAERLEAAKFVDKDFINKILNVTGNRAGLVSYSSALSSSINLTDQQGILESEIDSYVANGATCISCGIYEGARILTKDNTKPIHSDIWKYSADYQFMSPPLNWTLQTFNDSAWKSGATVLGFGGVNTVIFNGSHVDLWDMWQDAPAPVDFSSGMNSTANTFGLIGKDIITQQLQNIHFDGPSQANWNEQGDVVLVSSFYNISTIFFDTFESYYSGTGQNTLFSTEINRSPGYWITDGLPAVDKEIFIMSNQSGYAAFSGVDVVVMRDMDAFGSIEKGIDVSNFSSINLSYYWKLGPSNFGVGDYGNVRVSTNGGGSWTTIALYDTNNDDNIWRNQNIDLSSFNMSSTFKIRFGCLSNNDNTRCYWDDISIIGLIDYFNLKDFFMIDSNNALSGSLSQPFIIPNANIHSATLQFNYSMNKNLFSGTATMFCNITHPGGNTTVWSASYTQATVPVAKPIQQNISILNYLTNPSFTYGVNCGARVTSGGGRTIVAIDDITVQINYTSNGDDGWDWARGNLSYGTWGDNGASGDYPMTAFFDPSAKTNGTPRDNSKRISIEIGGTQCGSSCGWMDSGSFGIQFNITPQMFASIQAGSRAIVTFDYEAFDRECIMGGSDDTEESVWIKARFGNDQTTSYLGYDLDTGQGTGLFSGQDPEDNTPEILYDWSSIDNNCWHANNLRGDFNKDNDNDYNGGTFSQDVTSLITKAGWYYLDFGAKFDSSGGWQSTTEGIIAYFDNIDLTVYDKSGNFYFRNSFTIEDLNSIAQPKLYVYSDNGADVYLNGNLISSDLGPHNASYWNVNGDLVGLGNFSLGVNTLAVKLYNNDSISAKFDLELQANVSNIPKALIVMSDGQANYCHGPSDGQMDNNSWTGDCVDSQAINETISFACFAHQYFGISIYTVAFGIDADTQTLNRTACCDDCSHFYTSRNVSELANAYKKIAESLINIDVSQFNQTINLSGQYIPSTLFPDSYIEYTYTAEQPSLQFGSIPIKIESPAFGNVVTTGTVNIPQGVNIDEFKVTSYSGNRWTDTLLLQNNFFPNYTSIFNLSMYDPNYRLLGDPYIVSIPANDIASGNNNLIIKTGIGFNQSTNGSADDRALYTLRIDATVNYTGVYTKAKGCIWHVKFEDGTQADLKVPTNYTGTDTCDFENNIFDVNDAIDQSVYQLFTLLDYDNNKKLIVTIDSQDIETKIISLGGIPFMWGPITMEIRVWS